MRAITRPAIAEAPISPSIIGVRNIPEGVGATPLTTCMNIGTKVMVPNIAPPTISPTRFDTTKLLIRNRPSGRIGSFAARSVRTKPAKDIASSPISASIPGLRHGRLTPPMEKISTVQDSVAASSTAPR